MSTIEVGRVGNVGSPQSALGAAVRVRGVGRTFGDFTALHEVDLEIPAGSCTVILGPSGCGKTTLLRCVAGLTLPSSGTIEIGSRDVTRTDPGKRPVGMVFQDFGLYPDKNAARNIEFPLRMARIPKPHRATRVKEIGAMLQVSKLLHRKPRELSGGQRQRVGIGRAVAPRPKVLLMDEPLSALDAKLRTEMRAELHLLKTSLGMTILYVTHDQVEAMSLADQLVVMREGRIEQVGAPEDVYARPASTYVAQFLGETNILDCIVGTRGQIMLRDDSGQALPLDARVDHEPGTSVQLGIRSNDITLGAHRTASDTEFHIPVQVELIERLGPSNLAHVTTPSGLRLRVNTSTRETVDVGAGIVTIPRAAVMIFEPDGKRLDTELESIRS